MPVAGFTAIRLSPETRRTRSLTGAEQERWLLNGFQQSQARWDVLGQQVFFSQVELTPGRVVLTGDVHSHWAAEVHERFDDPSSPVVATGLSGVRSAGSP